LLSLAGLRGGGCDSVAALLFASPCVRSRPARRATTLSSPRDRAVRRR